MSKAVMNQQTNQSTNGQTTVPAESAPVLYCAYHPTRETVLRCNRCGNPMCTECAVLTEVGYRCRQCVRSQRQVYFNAQPADPVIAGLVALVLGGLIGLVAYLFLGSLGFFSLLIAFFAGPAAGGFIAEAVRRSIGRRRFHYLGWTAAICVVAGILLAGLLLLGLQPGGLVAILLRGPAFFIGRWYVLLFAVLAGSTTYARLK